MKILKTNLTVIIALAACFTLLSFTTRDMDDKEESAFKEEFKITWDNLKAYTLQVAEIMPAEKYDYRPTEAVRTFGEQYKHISFTFYFMPGVFIEGKQLQFDPNYINNKELVGGTKEEVISLLSQRFDYVENLVMGMSSDELTETIIIPFANNRKVTKEQLIKWLMGHTTHHRGQTITYLRMNDIAPPAYNGW